MNSKPSPFKNPFLRWVDDRLPVLSPMHEFMITYPTPKNLNYWWNFGVLAIVMLMIMILSGLFLAMQYDPTTEGAFASVDRIMRNVNYGWLIRYIHMNGAFFFFAVTYIHMLRGMYYGSYKAPRELLWILGVIILVLMIATGFLGYVLPWGQMSVWGAIVITKLFTAIPVAGEEILLILQGGFSVDNPTLNRFFVLHFLLPFVLLGAVGLHVLALHSYGSNNPLGIDMKGPQDSISFHPYYTTEKIFTLGIFFFIFSIFVFFMPEAMGEAVNNVEADKLNTPAHIVPEWYLLPFYAILRSIPDKLGGVLAMGGALGILALLPWLDTSKVRSGTFRPVFKIFFWLFVFNAYILAIVGAGVPDANFVFRIPITGWWADGTLLEWSKYEWPITNLTIGRIATVYYFAYFIPILPILGLVEKTKPLPASISKPIAG